MQQIYRRTPIRKCNFDKVAKQLYWNRTSTSVFSCKFVTYFQITFSEKDRWMAASVRQKPWISKRYVSRPFENIFTLKTKSWIYSFSPFPLILKCLWLLYLFEGSIPSLQEKIRATLLHGRGARCKWFTSILYIE